MRIWAFDPGAVNTGYASLRTHEDPHTPVWTAGQSDGVLGVVDQLRDPSLRPDVVLIEDYSHGGAFTKEAKQTLKVLGALEYIFKLNGYRVQLVHKDRRLSGQGPAAKLMGGTVSDLKKDPLRKDAFSALAHCVVYERELMARG